MGTRKPLRIPPVEQLGKFTKRNTCGLRNAYSHDGSASRGEKRQANVMEPINITAGFSDILLLCLPFEDLSPNILRSSSPPQFSMFAPAEVTG